MQLGQIRSNGAVIAAVFEGGLARPIPGTTRLDLIRRAEIGGEPLTELAAQLASRHPDEPRADASHPSARSLGLRLHLRNQRLLPRRRARHARRHVRARLSRGAAGDLLQGHGAASAWATGQPIGIRARFAVHGAGAGTGGGARQPRHSIVGYTLANDVSAWDIERENALYLPQSKVYDALLRARPGDRDGGRDAGSLSTCEMTCTITRDGKVLYSGEVNTARLHRRLETLVEYLTRANHVPDRHGAARPAPGSSSPQEAALAPGDMVTIRVPEIGELTNTVAMVS